MEKPVNATMAAKIQAHIDNEIAVSGTSVGETVGTDVALAVPPMANNGSVVLVTVTVSMVLAGYMKLHRHKRELAAKKKSLL